MYVKNNNFLWSAELFEFWWQLFRIHKMASFGSQERKVGIDLQRKKKDFRRNKTFQLNWSAIWAKHVKWTSVENALEHLACDSNIHSSQFFIREFTWRRQFSYSIYWGILLATSLFVRLINTRVATCVVKCQSPGVWIIATYCSHYDSLP